MNSSPFDLDRNVSPVVMPTGAEVFGLAEFAQILAKIREIEADKLDNTVRRDWTKQAPYYLGHPIAGTTYVRCHVNGLSYQVDREDAAGRSAMVSLDGTIDIVTFRESWGCVHPAGQPVDLKHTCGTFAVCDVTNSLRQIRYQRNGRLDNPHGPALMSRVRTGWVVAWIVDGRPGHSDGPAVVIYDSPGFEGARLRLLTHYLHDVDFGTGAPVVTEAGLLTSWTFHLGSPTTDMWSAGDTSYQRYYFDPSVGAGALIYPDAYHTGDHAQWQPRMRRRLRAVAACQCSATRHTATLLNLSEFQLPSPDDIGTKPARRP
jgi:hypothetical protein